MIYLFRNKRQSSEQKPDDKAKSIEQAPIEPDPRSLVRALVESSSSCTTPSDSIRPVATSRVQNVLQRTPHSGVQVAGSEEPHVPQKIKTFQESHEARTFRHRLLYTEKW